jgi:hypothetical protein
MTTQRLIVTTPANSGQGDSPKSAFDKINLNFSDLYGTGTSGGAVNILFTAPGAPAPITVAAALIAQPINVTEYGAAGDGVTDDTAAFNLTALNCRPAVPYTGSTIAGAPAGDIYVPPGTYLITSQINTNGANITWTLADGAIITPVGGYALLNGRILRAGKQDTQYTFGIFYTATGFSTRNNVPVDSPPAVMGYLTPSQVSTYATKDSVACYADNTGVSPLATIAGGGTTYTTTTINFTTPLSASVLGQLRIGMIIQTLNNAVSFYDGFVLSWTSTSITVSGWFQQGNAAAGQTPPNGFGAYVSPTTKLWAYNGNVTLTAVGGAIARQGAGIEMGVLNMVSAPSGFIGTLPLLWAYDAVNLGTFACDTAFNARHNSAGFFTGFQVSGVNNAGTTVYGYFDQTIYGTPATGTVVGFIHAPANVAAAATGTVVSFQASPMTLGGGGATLGTQIGFLATAMSSATNNRGFVGQLAAGANNYNLYMSGTAQNYLQGQVGIGIVPTATNALLTGTTNLTGVVQQAIRAADTLSGTTVSVGVDVAATIAASTTVANFRGIEVHTVVLNGGSLVTVQDAIFVDDQLAGSTRASGIALNVSSGAGKFNVFAQGTAQNLMAGPLNFTGAASSVAAGVNVGGTTQTTVGAAGAASALPANPLGYLIAFVAGTKVAIPYYNG